MKIAYFYLGESWENLLIFTPMWELKLTNFSVGGKIYKSY